MRNKEDVNVRPENVNVRLKNVSVRWKERPENVKVNVRNERERLNGLLVSARRSVDRRKSEESAKSGEEKISKE